MAAARSTPQKQQKQKQRQKQQKSRNKQNQRSEKQRARTRRGPGRTGSGRAGTYGARAARPYAAALLAVLLVGALLLIVVASLGGGSGAGDDAAASPSSSGDGAVEPLPGGHPALALARREAGDPLALGDRDAPIVVVEYADFQDAFVGIHARQTHQQLISEYVDAGQVRLEFRNYPINGPESDAAARAAWAAGQQGRFWEFHDAALAEQFNLDSGRFDTESVRELARVAGVPDVDRLLRDMESDRAGEAVGRDAEEAYELGITGVPWFMINGHPVSGSQPLDAFREIIDPLLEAARDGDS